MYPMNMAQDNAILWATHPIVAHKTLTENDIDLGFACNKKTGEVFWGFTNFKVNPVIFQDLFEDYQGEGMSHGFLTSLGIGIYDYMPSHIVRELEMRKRVISALDFPLDCNLDYFVEKFGGPTRMDYISWINTYYAKIRKTSK